MSNDLEIPSHLNIRIDPKVRYLTELAARVRGVSLTEYVETTLQESFRHVYPIDSSENEVLSLKERRDKLAPPVDSLAHYADALWSENPGVRLALRAADGHDHLMSDEEKIIYDYILRRKELVPKGVLNQRAIAERWVEIKTAALAEERKRVGK